MTRLTGEPAGSSAPGAGRCDNTRPFFTFAEWARRIGPSAQAVLASTLFTPASVFLFRRGTTQAAGPASTETGVDLFLLVPSPTRPVELPPQHNTAPATVNAHVWLPPTVTLAAPLWKPVTSTGL